MTTLIGTSEAIVVGAGATGRTGPSIPTGGPPPPSSCTPIDRFERLEVNQWGPSEIAGAIWDTSSIFFAPANYQVNGHEGVQIISDASNVYQTLALLHLPAITAMNYEVTAFFNITPRPDFGGAQGDTAEFDFGTAAPGHGSPVKVQAHINSLGTFVFDLYGETSSTPDATIPTSLTPTAPWTFSVDCVAPGQPLFLRVGTVNASVATDTFLTFNAIVCDLNTSLSSALPQTEMHVAQVLDCRSR